MAEGTWDIAPEAFFPAIYEHLNLPYTGGNAAFLLANIDKRLSGKLYKIRVIRVPKGAFITKENIKELNSLPYPIFIKPNYEGSSKGITQDSVAETSEEVYEVARELLEKYPAGLNVEQYLEGREFCVPMLETYPGKVLEIVENSFEEVSDEKPIYDYHQKRSKKEVKLICPPELSPRERMDIFTLADRVYKTSICPDLGRVGIRLDNDGKPYFLEINPLPRILPDGSLATAAKACDKFKCAPAKRKNTPIIGSSIRSIIL